MNRLQHETSPYLLQHKDNPVDWYAWGEEAFSRAKAEHKPILLSIGYSSCHWCHVMAHESFEDDATATLMNKLYVNIKVDREERPDVDDIYMQAVMALRRSGGWPLTVFLLPDGRPFYGGTYYPPVPRYGMPSFKQVLEAVHDAFVNRYDEIAEQADNLTSALDRSFLRLDDVSDDGFNADLLLAGAKGILSEFDEIDGGFGGAPKFPNPMNLAYLLRYAHHTGAQDALHAVTFTLKKMANGGIYDHVGGGFHRYSVDALWLVPHFEKMLYDNAQLSRLYAQAYAVTGDLFFKRVACEIYDYVLREMTAPDGGFYSATDADSEGEEGKFFVWTLAELQEALAPLQDSLPNAYEIAIEYFGATQGGNFEGANILYAPTEAHIVAKRLNMTVEALEDALIAIKDRLYATRTNRIAPALDDKIISAWNGMMLASLAEGARLLDRPDYLSAAERGGAFFLSQMMDESGRLFRTSKDGVHKGNAYLEDYANLIDAFLELYQATFLSQWFKGAQKLAEFALAHFLAPTGDGFFDTSDDHEQLIVRPRSLQDNAIPSGNSMMAKQLVRLFAYTGNPAYEETARHALRPLLPAMRQYPQAFGEALNATDMLVRGLREVALIGNPTEPNMKAMLALLRQRYLPHVVVALARQAVPDPAQEPIALLHHRPQRDNLATAYVCQRFVCANPTTSVQELETLLRV